MRGGPHLNSMMRPTPSEAFEFNPEEVEIARYTPRLGLFLQRSLLLTLATLIAFVSVPLLDFSLFQRMLVAVTLVAAYTLVFEEWRDWQNNAGALWILTNQRIILDNTDDDQGPAWVNLQDIRKVSCWFWWSIRLRQTDGRAVVMAYVGPVKTIAQNIQHTKDSMKEDRHV